MRAICWLSFWIGCGSLAVPAVAGDSTVRGSTPGDTVTLIDAQLREVWRAHDISPAQPAEEGEWCRRVYLDLLGRIPRVSELRRFLADRDRDRRQKLVDRLIFSSEYEEEFSQNWADYWTVVLIGRSEGQRDNRMSRDGLTNYLYKAIRDNRAYDRLVHELITARGASSPDQDDYNGATNFLMLKVEENAIAATSKTAQIFLGTQIQCTQCHDHPFNNSTAESDWSQAQFWGMNSFFRQTVALRRFQPGSRDIAYGELADQDFGGEGSTPEEAEVYFAQRNGILQAAYPTFLDGTTLENRSGYLDDVVRRRELAGLMMDSPLLERALVNRLWGYFFGYGFTTPVDDFGPHNPPSHPELLDELAARFRASGFDLRTLTKWIVLSEAYGLSSRGGRGPAADDPSWGQPPQFSRFYMRQMRPEALYQSLVLAGNALDGSTSDRPADRQRWLRQFVIASGNDEGTEASTFNGTIPQTLMMFNGQLIRRATRLSAGSFLHSVITKDAELADRIETLYLAALARRPTGAEVRLARQLVAARARTWQNDPAARDREPPAAAALQDLWWVLLNSGEFILIH